MILFKEELIIVDISERIKALRLQNNLTLEQVGDIVGVGKSTVRKWETGEIKNMRRDKIAKLATALHTTPAYLMGWEDDIEKYSDEELDNAILEVFNRLSEEKQKQALDYMNFLASQD